MATKGFDNVNTFKESCLPQEVLAKGISKPCERGSDVIFINVNSQRSSSSCTHFLPLIKKSNKNKTTLAPEPDGTRQGEPPSARLASTEPRRQGQAHGRPGGACPVQRVGLGPEAWAELKVRQRISVRASNKR